MHAGNSAKAASRRSLSPGPVVGRGADRGFTGALADPVAVGIVVGLVLGRTVGVTLAAWLVARFTRAELDGDPNWVDVLAVALLAGIGFTVSLLIGELAFSMGTEREDHPKLAVLTGSLLAALLATVLIRVGNRVYRRIHEAETSTGIPDAYADVGGAGTAAGNATT